MSCQPNTRTTCEWVLDAPFPVAITIERAEDYPRWRQVRASSL
jgi:hypothetical protein